MPCQSVNFAPALGPLIQLAIMPHGFQPGSGASPPASPLNLKMFMALFDTGASSTAISAKVIQDVGLTSIGKKPVGGVHGQQPTNLYQFQVVLVFPQSQTPTGLLNASIAPFSVTGPEFVPSGPAYDVLLGRDIICRGTFSMSWDGHALFCI
jgi:hypothetical protein